MAHVVASTHSYAHEYYLIDNILQKKQTYVRKKREDIDFPELRNTNMMKALTSKQSLAAAYV